MPGLRSVLEWKPSIILHTVLCCLGVASPLSKGTILSTGVQWTPCKSSLRAATTLISPATLQTTAGKIHRSQNPWNINVTSLRGMWHGKDTKIPYKATTAAIWLYYMVHISPKIPWGRGRVIVILQMCIKNKVTMLLYRKRNNPALHGYSHHYWTSWLVTFQGGHFYASLYIPTTLHAVSEKRRLQTRTARTRWKTIRQTGELLPQNRIWRRKKKKLTKLVLAATY